MEQTGASPDCALDYYNKNKQTTWNINKEKGYLIVGVALIIICIICIHFNFKRIALVTFIAGLIPMFFK